MPRSSSSKRMVAKKKAASTRVKATRAIANGRSVAKSLDGSDKPSIISIPARRRMKHMEPVKPDIERLKPYIDKAMKEFHGDGPTLGAALGSLILAEYYGWKPALLIYDVRAIRKYEKALGIKLKDVSPEIGIYAHRSQAWKLSEKATAFWKVVKSEVAGRSAKILKGAK